MKVTLTFNLNKEDEARYFKLAQKAREMDMFINEFDEQSLRQRIKYTELTEKEYNLVEKIRDEFYELYNSHMNERE